MTPEMIPASLRRIEEAAARAGRIVGKASRKLKES
jgi:hypothetical protein